MADKDLDELMADLTKVAVSTVALSVAQLAVKKVTDQLTSTIGDFDKQVTNATKTIESLTSRLDDLYGKLSPLGGALKSVADNLDAINRTAETGVGAIVQNAQAMGELGANGAAAAKGQEAVKAALKGAGDEAEKNEEKLKKVQETAKELGTSMIDVFSALASGKEPMDVLKDKGAEMAKMLLKAKLDGVNLIETFKALGVATGILEVTTTGVAAAQAGQASASGKAAIKTEAAVAATLEQAAANRLFAGGALANVAGQTAMTVAAGEATIAFEAQAVAATEAAAAESVALAPIGIILAAIAVAAAGVAGVFAIAANEISGKVGDLTKDMGLTEEQLGRVKDKSVTMGDVAKATFEVLGERLKAVFGPGLKAIGDSFLSLYHIVTDVALRAVAFVVGSFAGAAQAIRVVWSMLPAAMGDVIISGVNLVLDGVGQMVNGAIDIANGLIGTVNWLAKKLGLSLQLPDLGQVHVAKLTNQFAGAAKAAGDAISGAFGQGFKGGFDGVMNIPAEVAGRAVEIAKVRIQEEVGNISPTSADGAACSCSKDGKAASSANSGTPQSAAAVQAYEQDLVAMQVEIPEDLITIPEVDLSQYLKLQEVLGGIAEKYEKIRDLAPDFGKKFEEAFGKSGKSMSELIVSWSNFSQEMASIRATEASGQTEGKRLDEERAVASIKGYGEMAAAAKGFFDKKTTGYAALEAVEKTYRLWQFAMNIKEMAQEATKTTTGVANSLARGAASAAAGASKIFEAMGPFGFPVVAAMLALLATLGLKGGAGTVSVPGADDMKTRQEAQGSGSTLGDNKAKSDSLEKALGYAEAYQNKDLEYGNAMVRSLRSIDDQIGAVASALAKSFGAGGMLSTEGLNLGKTGTAASLSNFGFGKTTTRTLQDQGIQFDAATLGAIVDGGLSGSTYQQVLETTKKKALFMPLGSKSTVTTRTGALDADFVDQVVGLITLLGKGVSDAADAIKATGVEEILASFKVDLGKLSFKDMTGTQIEEALNAVFGKLGDDMAKAAVPAIAQFQKVGEGAFETLVRVARQYEVIDTTLTSIGMTFKETGVASLEAREHLVELVGGLDALTEQASFFADNFLSEAERLAPVQANVTAELTRLGQATDLTREQFKNLVMTQDVSTASGAALYAALLDLAPAFDKVAGAAEAAQDKRASIQDQIDEMTLSSADLLAKTRAKERAEAVALDPALGALIDKLYGLQDASTQAAKDAELVTSRTSALADLLDAQGNSDGAKALRRGLELDGITDPYVRSLKEQTYATEDAKIALDRASAARKAELEAVRATAAAFQEVVDQVNAARQGLLRAGDVAGAMAGEVKISGGLSTDSTTAAIMQSRIAQGLLKQVNDDALNVENVRDVINKFNGVIQSDAVKQFVQQGVTTALTAGLLGGDIGAATSALTPAITALTTRNLNRDFSLAQGAYSSVLAAQAEYDRASQRDVINGREYVGAEVIGYQKAIVGLDDQLDAGTLTLEGYATATTNLRAAMGPTIDIVDDLGKQIDEMNRARARLGSAGMSSISFYFNKITDAADALAASAREAEEPISLATQAIGRLTSISDVLGDSARAASFGWQGGGTVAQAKLIAESAAIAAKTITTTEAAAVAVRLAGNSAFAGQSADRVRDLSLLIGSSSRTDPAEFEKAFTRMNAALIRGTINQVEYQALFTEALGDTTSALSDLQKTAKSLADQLSISSAATPALGYAEAERQYRAALAGGDSSALNSAVQALLEAGDASFTSSDEKAALDARLLSDLRGIELGGTASPYVEANAPIVDRLDDLNAEIKQLRADLNAANAKLVRYSESTADSTDRTRAQLEAQA